MTDLFKERIVEYVKPFVKINGRDINDDDEITGDMIMSFVKIIISNKVMTSEQMSNDLLKYDVLLSPYVIEQWVKEAR